MKKTKKSQILLISSSLILLSLLFIYSVETENYYITNFEKTNIVTNIELETCQISYNSNGSYLDERYLSFSNFVNSYCQTKPFTCNLTIQKQSSAPTNLSLLNYTHFNKTFQFQSNTISHSQRIIC